MTDQVTSTGRTFSTSIIQREVIHAQGHRGSNQNSAVLRSDMASSCHPVGSRPGCRGRVTGWSDAQQRRPTGVPPTAPPRKETPCPARTSPVRRPPPARPSSPSTATTSSSTSRRGPETFSTRSTIHFTLHPARRRAPSSTSSAAPSSRSPSTAPTSTRPSVYADSRVRLPGPGRRERRGRRRHRPLHQHRRGPAPLRRPGRRRGLPLQPVRGARQPAHVRRLRAARPQGPLHLHGDRAGPLAGRLQLPHPAARAGRRRRRHVALRAHRADLELHHRARRRPLRRGARHGHEPRAARCRSASSAASR